MDSEEYDFWVKVIVGLMCAILACVGYMALRALREDEWRDQRRQELRQRLRDVDCGVW